MCQRAIKTMMIAKTWQWMQLWLAIKPNLKCTQFGKYKKEYEDKIAEAEANIGRATDECNAVTDVYNKLAAEKNELVLALQSGGSAVQVQSLTIILSKYVHISFFKNFLLGYYRQNHPS